jgi:hypothetical protein
MGSKAVAYSSSLSITDILHLIIWGNDGEDVPVATGLVLVERAGSGTLNLLESLKPKAVMATKIATLIDT